jgi:lipid II:glycine glycyltransferase (peptidoglycan interpeptide bridge formation enzyme)
MSSSTDWNSFVAASPYGDVLQCLEWGEVKKTDWQPLPIALEKNGTLCATALGLLRKIPYSDRNMLYISRGPIVDWSDENLVRELFVKIGQEAQKHKVAFIKVDPALPVEDGSTPVARRVLGNIGFVASPDAQNSFGGTQPRYNMKLDISAPLDEVMKTFHQKWRYNIRLGAKKGLVVQSDCSKDDLRTFHEIYKTTAARDGFTGYSLAYFEDLWDALVPRNLAKLFLVRHEEKVLSGAISFLLPPQCWYVFGASSNEGRNLMPNHAMQWAMMQWAKENNCTTYDFRGVHDVRQDPNYADFGGDLQRALMESSDGLVRFKAGFGAQLVEYIGEYDWPLDKKWYWLWTKARPALAQAVRKVRGRG